MDVLSQKTCRNSKTEWRIRSLLTLYITLLLVQICSSEELSQNITNIEQLDNNLVPNECHNCRNSSNKSIDDYINHVIRTFKSFTYDSDSVNRTVLYLEETIEKLFQKVLTAERLRDIEDFLISDLNNSNSIANDKKDVEVVKGRGLFSKYTYEYRMYQKIKHFINTYILSINLPMAAKSFGLNKFFIPLLIGGQVLIKSILFAMFLPSILGSFGKMLGKGISHLSAASSQASYPPANDDQPGYNTDGKDSVGYETYQTGALAYPPEGAYGDGNDVSEPGNVDMSRFGDSQKNAYLPSKNSYYHNQMATANNYKVFQKIPASSMILSNYDPFYSPLLSRLDGIFARLGLAPSETSVDSDMQVGGQSLNDAKLESCREQLICHMYASPAKYAPYSNLVSAQLSRELNELRRPVSDNPEILRFFKYMKAARRGQEGVDCNRAHPGCTANTAPAHTMIAAYHDINKLVTARKLH